MAWTLFGKPNRHAQKEGPSGAEVRVVVSDYFERGKAALEAGNPDADALFRRAYDYVERESPKTAAWWAYEIGNLYFTGPGADLEKAAEWSERAATKGDAYGAINAGVARARLGKGRAAIRWYAKAAEVGEAQGAFEAGCLYRDGRGDLPADGLEAIRWFTKADAMESPKAAHALGVVYGIGAAGIEPDGNLAVKWFAKAATDGDDRGESAWSAGVIHAKGIGGLPPNPSEAAEWFRRAIALGYAEASDWLAEVEAEAPEGEAELKHGDDLADPATSLGDNPTQ